MSAAAPKFRQLSRVTTNKINVKVKGGGQKCPPHKDGGRIAGSLSALVLQLA
jgi:hypothetical protein